MTLTSTLADTSCGPSLSLERMVACDNAKRNPVAPIQSPMDHAVFPYGAPQVIARPIDATLPCSIITTSIPFNDADEEFWWTEIANVLAVMLLKSNYDMHQSYRYLLHLRTFVAHMVGPRPVETGLPIWKSFCTDDFTPFEPSWNWDGQSSTVRYSFEPITRAAGSQADPFNQHAVRLCMAQMAKYDKSMDMWLFNYFENAFFLANDEANAIKDRIGADEHRTQSFLGLDLNDGEVDLKAYFFPILKSLASHRSQKELVWEAIRGLPLFRQSLEPLADYLSQEPTASKLSVEMIAIDCNKPSKSRIKVYVRTPGTSLSHVRDVYMLGGKLENEANNAALAAIEELWPLVFDIKAGQKDEDELTPKAHRTSGMIFNFELRPGAQLPIPKIYLPVRHYATSDSRIATGLAVYFRRRGWVERARNYVDTLKTMFPNNDLENDVGTHTYVSVAWKRDVGVALTAYYNPKVYSRISRKGVYQLA